MQTVYVIGPIGSGKDVVADYLVSRGFTSFRLSDVIRKKATGIGLPINRQTLQDLGNKLRIEHGDTYLAKVVAQQIKESNRDKVVIIGARNKAEPEYLKKVIPSLTILYIDCPTDIRKVRVLHREKMEDKESERSVDDALALDIKGVEPSKYLSGVKVIKNNDTLEELYSRIDEEIAEV